MFKKSDLYTFTHVCPLYRGPDKIGTFEAEYQVTKYDDVQLKDASAVSVQARQFLVRATQRISIFNPAGMNVSVVTYPDIDSNKRCPLYTNYPVLINTTMGLDPGQGGSAARLVDYSPRTVNTKIQASGTLGDSSGKTSSTSKSSTVGSSMSQTNSFGASLSPESFGINAEHSETVTHEHSTTTGSEDGTSSNRDVSSSAQMSMKDWGAYALINPVGQGPTWTFGQEYPWDAIECRATNGVAGKVEGQVQVLVPSSMTTRLHDGNTLYPPSQLSMFGVNFVMKAQWVVTIGKGAPDTVQLNHLINYYMGSHEAPSSAAADGDSGSATVYIDKVPAVLNEKEGDPLTAALDLALMALNPLGGRSRAAIIGFIPDKFVVVPSPAPQTKAFKIGSNANNLLIQDTTTYPNSTPAGGFTASQTSLSVAFSAALPMLQMSIYYKIADSAGEYSLYIKHWRRGGDVMLTLVFNGDTANSVTKYVDADEAEGGEGNLLKIRLRELSYDSVDYHDFLKLGLNSIDITIQPIDPKQVAGCTYQVRAVSIEAE